jgi:hypothetical protein
MHSHTAVRTARNGEDEAGQRIGCGAERPVLQCDKC